MIREHDPREASIPCKREGRWRRRRDEEGCGHGLDIDIDINIDVLANEE
jgi:hypothetical protein